ncbi:MAG: hypothetical protein JNG86_06170, partial [Verrucomicrobiaceae bacterium]|nr:hypothetical protein [Verrucomicrobiaceae bacterium]
GKIEAGSVSDQLICQIDLLSTFAALTGSDAKGPDSLNMLPALLGQPDKPLRTELVLAPHKKTHLALRDGPWLYIGARGGGGFNAAKPGEHGLGGGGALKFTGETNSDFANGKLKPDAPEQQLYKLSDDPRQTKNVIREHPEIAKRMALRLAEMQQR